jgi:2-keto-3-deoxy-L-rhamnonate aldolase RhmA
MNALRDKLRQGRVLGCIQVMASADVTEVLAGSGIDMLMIDHEHGTASPADLVAQLRALKGTGVPALVRVPSFEAAYVNRLQDAGVDSILFPAVETAEQARELVALCKYPPAGGRGAGGGLRATGYDRDPDYYARANDDVLVGVQIESARGVEAAAAICAVPGVDLVVIGPRDLSASIGKLGRFDDPEVQALFAQAERRVRDAGIAMGTVVYPGLRIQDMFGRGHALVLAGTDIAFLARSARAAAEAPRA